MWTKWISSQINYLSPEGLAELSVVVVFSGHPCACRDRMFIRATNGEKWLYMHTGAKAARALQRMQLRAKHKKQSSGALRCFSSECFGEPYEEFRVTLRCVILNKIEAGKTKVTAKNLIAVTSINRRSKGTRMEEGKEGRLRTATGLCLFKMCTRVSHSKPWLWLKVGRGTGRKCSSREGSFEELKEEAIQGFPLEDPGPPAS